MYRRKKEEEKLFNRQERAAGYTRLSSIQMEMLDMYVKR
jgi:DNA replication protein DnaD